MNDWNQPRQHFSCPFFRCTPPRSCLCLRHLRAPSVCIVGVCGMYSSPSACGGVQCLDSGLGEFVWWWYCLPFVWSTLHIARYVHVLRCMLIVWICIYWASRCKWACFEACCVRYLTVLVSLNDDDLLTSYFYDHCFILQLMLSNRRVHFMRQT